MTDCPWDLNGDGVVDSDDIAWLIDHWGTCAPGSKGDFNNDGLINSHDVDILKEHFGPCPGSPTPIEITCTGATPHFPSGCKLLLAADRDNDGKVTSMDAMMMQQSGATTDEVNFILDAASAGSINAICPGCYGVTPPPPPPPGNETRTMSLTEGSHTIQVSLSGYDTLQATINVSSTGVTCTVGPCGTTGPPGVTTSGWTVTTYLKTATTVSDVCTWIDSIGGWGNLQWSSHVLEAYYVYIGASGHSIGFSPVTWNDVLGLYYYYINDPTAGNGKIGCGT